MFSQACVKNSVHKGGGGENIFSLELLVRDLLLKYQFVFSVKVVKTFLFNWFFFYSFLN